MTAHLIDMQWQNTLADYCAEGPDFCFTLGQFLGENLSWMRYQIKDNPADAYWHQVSGVISSTVCRFWAISASFLGRLPPNLSAGGKPWEEF